MEPNKESKVDFIDKVLSSGDPIDGNELYKEFTEKSKIEKYKEEDNVLRMMIRGQAKSEIIKNLNDKYRKEEVKFTLNDVEKFLSRNTQIIEYLEDDKTRLVRRHLEARTGVEESMRDLLIFTQHHLNKANNEGDTRTTNDTIRTLNDVLKTYAKLKGFDMDNQTTAIQVNISDEIVNRKSSLIKKVVEADFKIDNGAEENKVLKD